MYIFAADKLDILKPSFCDVNTFLKNKIKAYNAVIYTSVVSREKRTKIRIKISNSWNTSYNEAMLRAHLINIPLT